MFGLESPDFLRAFAFDAINKAVCGTHKDQVIHDTGSADGGFSEAESPEYPAVSRIQSIQGVIHRGEINRLLCPDRGRRDRALGMEAPLQVSTEIDGVIIAAFTSGIHQLTHHER